MSIMSTFLCPIDLSSDDDDDDSSDKITFRFTMTTTRRRRHVRFKPNVIIRFVSKWIDVVDYDDDDTFIISMQPLTIKLNDDIESS